jgi:2-polyprenyl-6-methoxyphenol hydroxylase-like FAD-dependent oxidoreductase
VGPDSEIVIVGGGIAGMSAACALAGDGHQVTVLEASMEYADRVRGESMVPWGVAEAGELGVLNSLLEADARLTETWVHYDAFLPTEVSLANRIPAGLMLPGVSGSLNLRHPEACEALAKQASGSGARVERGVSDVAVRPGSRPEVTARRNTGELLEFRPHLVIGADGRNSVVRRQIGIELQRHEATHISFCTRCHPLRRRATWRLRPLRSGADGADEAAAERGDLHGVNGSRGLRQPADPAGQVLRAPAERAADEGHVGGHVRRPGERPS